MSDAYGFFTPVLVVGTASALEFRSYTLKEPKLESDLAPKPIALNKPENAFAET